ncbi:MAG TPA: glycosyltransferase [Bryobacteraceae bacterium]|nr:glycosyltransferase [Bryobacteraceae bacterium]
MEMPLVSVVMSVFNCKPYVRDAIDSILAQCYSNFEFIIIDDGSTDGSTEILIEYDRNHANVSLLRQENSGLIESLNRGCALANGTYIARMDADDVALTDRLARQVAYLEQHPNVAAVGGAVRYMNTAGELLHLSSLNESSAEIRRRLLDGSPMYHPAVLMRRDAFLRVGGYRKAVVDAEDYDLWLRLSDKYDLANLPEVVLHYRVHAQQVSMRKCKRQALGSLAARAAAVCRWRGEVDPLDTVEAITDDTFTRMGISTVSRESAVGRALLCCVDYLDRADDAAGMATMMPRLYSEVDWSAVAPPVASDFWLLQSRLAWSGGRPITGAIQLLRAIWVRPLIVGRPIKRIVQSWLDVAKRTIFQFNA